MKAEDILLMYVSSRNRHYRSYGILSVGRGGGGKLLSGKITAADNAERHVGLNGGGLSGTERFRS